MNIPGPNSAMLQHIRERLKPTHGVNAEHRCVIGTCSYASWRIKKANSSQPVWLYVCRTSLQYHFCGKHECKSIPIEHCNGTKVCPISAAEVDGPAEVYYPSRNRGRNATQTPFSHTMAPEKSAKPSKRKRPAHAPTSNALSMLFASKSSEELREASRRRQAQKVSRAVQESPQFLDQMKAARALHPRKRRCLEIDDRINKLSPDLHAYITRIKPCIGQCKGHNALVAACVSFLAKGLSHNGVQIIPKMEWVSELAPVDTDYGKIPGFQSRPLSVASRTIKTHATTASGAPNVAFLFNSPVALPSETSARSCV